MLEDKCLMSLLAIGITSFSFFAINNLQFKNMFAHYLKIAWRNLLKYKTQTVISVLGLAIGFTAFAFTMSWIRYKKGYDSSNSLSNSSNTMFDKRGESGLPCGVPSVRWLTTPSVSIPLCRYFRIRAKSVLSTMVLPSETYSPPFFSA